MATPVELPQLGNTVEECLITRWVKRKGDTVSPGDIVAEIETDKTTFEITAPIGGTVLETFFDEGALVKVFTNIFVIGQPGENVAGFDPRSARLRASRSGEPSGGEQPESATSEQRRIEDSLPRQSAEREGGPFSPRARRFAADHNFHPVSVAGSGPGGRVLESDVRREYASASKAPAASSNLRATIARRMRESLASAAQYTLNASAGAAGLLALRARLKAASPLSHINVNDLVTFCTIQALLDTPDLNAEFIDGRLVKHAEVHIGFAVDTPRGLLAPVVRNAHALSVSDLAVRMKELATKAIDGTIAPDSLSGGTFTISNLGGLGIESFTPLINVPQVAILGVGAIQLKPVRVNGKVEFLDSIGFSLTCDHQVIDGAPGARFLKVLRDKIEGVESLVGI
jgi:pyruvate dehydrogenase E2 component (dihydrolipoamide acetyltransferase)